MLLFLFEFYRYFLTILFKQNIGAILSVGWRISRYCSNKVIITVIEFTGINYYPTRPVFHFHHHHHRHHQSSSSINNQSSSSPSSYIIITIVVIIIIITITITITITIVVIVIIANNTPAEFCLKSNQGLSPCFRDSYLARFPNRTCTVASVSWQSGAGPFIFSPQDISNGNPRSSGIIAILFYAASWTILVHNFSQELLTGTLRAEALWSS